MPSLRPSEVRELMMRDLEGLRASLDDLARAADSDRGRLRACSAELRERLLAFLEREDSILAPALEKTDYWGPKRLELMRCEHAPHWAAVGDLARAANEPDVDLVALALRAKRLRFDLHRDLDEEERSLLIAEVLQDDVTSTDQSDG
jgi:hypothetical protein